MSDPYVCAGLILVITALTMLVVGIVDHLRVTSTNRFNR